MPTVYRPALLPALAANIKAGAYLPASKLAWGDDKRVMVAGAGRGSSPPFSHVRRIS